MKEYPLPGAEWFEKRKKRRTKSLCVPVGDRSDSPVVAGSKLGRCECGNRILTELVCYLDDPGKCITCNGGMDLSRGATTHVALPQTLCAPSLPLAVAVLLAGDGANLAGILDEIDSL